MILTENLEASLYDILTKQMQHDVAAILKHTKQCATQEGACYYKRLEWQQQRLRADF